MGAGTLYGSLKRMLADGLIEEAGDRPDPMLDDERRRYYRLIALGRLAFEAELRRYREVVLIAQRRGIAKQSHWTDRLFELGWTLLDRCTDTVKISLRPNAFQTPGRSSSSMCSEHGSRLFILDRIKHTPCCHNVEGRRRRAMLIHKAFELMNLSRSERTERAIVTFGHRIDSVEACGPRQGSFSWPNASNPDRNPGHLDWWG